MSTASPSASAVPGDAELEHEVETEHKVTPLELFFDLVFVLAITQVTQLMADDPTWKGAARGMLVLAVIWWAWAAYAWLTNDIEADEGGTRIAMFAAATAMLVVALALPGAFNENAAEFAIAYTAVRAMHIALYALATNDVGVRHAILRLAPPSAIACLLLVGASFLTGVPQGAMWAAAIVADYGGALIFARSGYRVHPAHFVERHGLIIIIALGESIVALGIGASSHAELVPAEILAAVLGMTVAAALWWTYFDVTAIVAERRLASMTGADRTRLARDSFSFLHLPLVAGIVLFALGTKKTLEYWDKPLDTVPAAALCGGVGLFFLAHVARRARAMHTFGTHRFVAAIGAFALIPLATAVDALIALSAVAVLSSALVAYEAFRFRESRRKLRASAH